MGEFCFYFPFKVVYQDDSFVWDIHSEMSVLFCTFCIIQERKSCLRFSIEVIIVKWVPEAKGDLATACGALECRRWVLLYSYTPGCTLGQGLQQGAPKAHL